jgi:hypothetical protein
MSKEPVTVHFCDEHILHYEALALIEEDFADLHVWSYGHIRIIEHVSYSADHLPMTWHYATISEDGKSYCEKHGGFMSLTEEEREQFHSLAASAYKPEQGEG